MFANFATAISTSTAVTLALFYLMNLLVAIQPQALVEPREYGTLQMVRIPKDEPPPRTIEHRPDPKTFEPPTPPASRITDPGETISVRVPPAGPPPVNTPRAVGLAISDHPLVAVVRVRPDYPARAQQAGLEGWVLVQFDVQASGTVTNVTIVDSSDSLFERSAQRAAERFRFKARVVDGVPVETTGVQNLFTFRMEN